MLQDTDPQRDAAGRIASMFARFGRLPTAVKRVITTIEFGLSAGCVWAAWTAGGDMALIVPALILGLFFALIGIATVSELTARTKALCVGLCATVFVGIGGFLYWHFLPKAPDVTAMAAQPPKPATTPTPPKPKSASNISRMILECDSPKSANPPNLKKRKADFAKFLDLAKKLRGLSIEGNVTEDETTFSIPVNSITGINKQTWLIKRSDDKLYVAITNELGASAGGLGFIFALASLAPIDPDEDIAKQTIEQVERFIHVESGKCKFL